MTIEYNDNNNNNIDDNEKDIQSVTLHFQENTSTYCSPQYYTPHLCYIHNLSVFRLEITAFHLRVDSVVSHRFTLRSTIHQFTFLSTSV